MSVVSLLFMVAVGCTKPHDNKGVAAVTGSGGPGAGPSLSPLEQARMWSQCMRQHGIEVTDPYGAGNDVHRGDIVGKPDNNKAHEAEQACFQYTITADGPTPDPPNMDLALSFSRCMRAHGVENFPDPDVAASFTLNDEITNDPQYAAARQVCDREVPKSAASAK